AVFQALTADVDAWWPQREQAGSRMVLEGVVNGRFYERFDDADRGVLLGVVTLIKPREQIRFSGPLGIADKAAISSVSWVLEPDGPRTTLHVQHALFGDVDEVTRDACLNWWREVMGHYLARYLVSEPRRWYQDDTETGHGLARKSTDKVA
ncbi:MAG: hypothetical protein KC425_03650, partial [Anaerolineales bacterium]|nr:hypothetical protein [Anaerolineales bacterium]